MGQITVVIKPTRNCNLRCKYCSVGEPNSSRLRVDEAKIIVDKIVRREPKSRTKFIWHGGEPLLMGIEFYKEIVAFQADLRAAGYRISNCVQTNGTLINNEWADFFRKHDFGVGLSIDGPKEINDLTRIFGKGIGAFDKIQSGTRVLDAHGIKYGFLVVISQYNATRIDEIIDFMKENKMRFKLVAVSPIGRASEAKDEIMMTGDTFSESQLRLFQRWLDEGDDGQRAALWKYMVPVLTGEPVECIFLEDCQQGFIGVDSSGDAYPCGRFCGGKQFLFGNLLTDSFEQVWDSEARLKLVSRAANPPEQCQGCDYRRICNGGCPLQGLLSGGLDQPDYNCEQYRRIFGTMEQKIKNLCGIQAL